MATADGRIARGIGLAPGARRAACHRARRLPADRLDGAVSLFNMLAEADLPDEIEALRVFALESIRTITSRLDRAPFPSSGV